ncbi:hypothetical protein [Methylovulum psychrotolerans]|uniref:Lipoprotein n=1 Tax=Methylovulum psychrotolerans TaxID=1704499 RepID=A0A2S5CJE4_9GAMM|nr:hypothetical protein [Methylovulum psychrotolerans]POZ50935.1 hypothetical protein AADEFJLK_03407 [Methylovulum psychrotolerans]
MKRFLILFLLLMVAACSNKPGDSEIQSQVLPLLATASTKDIADIKNLRKTNGYETDGNTYAIDIAYDLVFKVNYADLAKTSMPKDSPDGLIEGLQSVITGFNLLGLNVTYGNFKAGDRFVKQDHLTFIKTENGWMLTEPPESPL